MTPSPSSGDVAKLVEGLRAGLDGVTPGPWTLIPMRAIEDEDDEEGEVIGYSPASIEGGDGNPVCLFADPGGSGTLFENAADHAHILRCSPDNIAKLLTALESLSRELAEARERVSILEALTATPLFSHRALTAKLCEIMATRFGVRFLDPPDGGDVPIHEQVERMADALATAQTRIAALEDAVRVKDEALAGLVNARALKGVREQVAGWNGDGRDDGPYPRHDPRLGATLPKTNCGAVYELDEAMTRARTALSNGEPQNG